MKKYIVFVGAVLLTVNVTAMQIQEGMELITAAKRLDAQRVEELLNLDTYDIERKDDEGLTALFHAVRPPFYYSRLPLCDEKENQTKIINLLMAKNAEINIQNKFNQTIGFFAHQTGWEHVKRALYKN